MKPYRPRTPSPIWRPAPSRAWWSTASCIRWTQWRWALTSDAAALVTPPTVAAARASRLCKHVYRGRSEATRIIAGVCTPAPSLLSLRHARVGLERLVLMSFCAIDMVFPYDCNTSCYLCGTSAVPFQSSPLECNFWQTAMQYWLDTGIWKQSFMYLKTTTVEMRNGSYVLTCVDSAQHRT